MSLTTWLAVAVAGAIGAPARFLVERAVQKRHRSRFPFGTFAVNTSGTILYSFVSGLAVYHGFPNAPRIVLTTAFCGAYTKFSAFAYEVVRLTETRATTMAATYLASSVMLGWLLAAAGMALAAAL